MSGGKHSVSLRHLAKLPAEVVIANLTGAVAEAAYVSLADLADALGGSSGVADGDKGDVVVSGSGTSWMLDSAVATAAGRTLMAAADAAAQRTALACAPLASPTFTGAPAAPTASGGTNTTQLATTAFVQAAVASLIASAPGALDTLDELAAALGDDASFAATMTTALSGKQPIDAGLSSIAALGATAGLVEKTATDTYTERLIGVGASSSIPTRADGDGRWQALHAILTALAGLNATAGLVEQTGASAFTKRLIGVANATDVPTRSDADTRYSAAAHAHTQSDVSGLVAALALLAPLASAALTGAPTAPTAAPGTDTTQIATTAFVTAATAGGGLTTGQALALASGFALP